MNCNCLQKKNKNERCKYLEFENENFGVKIMAKIVGKIIKVKHEWEKVNVMRPYGNETLVEPEENESIDSIIGCIQTAINGVLPYVGNCPIGHWTGRATTYITIQPIKGDNREKLIERLNELRSPGACLLRDHDFDGRVQLILFTPSPGDSITPADEEIFDEYIYRR